LRIALAAGGTGGHIMPTLALGAALKKAQPDVELLYFSGRKEQEIRWYGQAGVTPVQLPAAPLSAGIGGKIRAALATLRAVGVARKTLKAFRPDCLVGLGSYVAGSSILAAMTLRIPFIIHEQNSVAGKANRWLAGRASRIATTYPQAFQEHTNKPVVVTGVPLRQDVLPPGDRAQARAHFGLDPEVPVLLVFGASQGARGLNQALLEFLRNCSSPSDLNWQVLWITGTDKYSSVVSQVAEFPCAGKIRLFPFVQEMGMAYAAAEVVVCRASSSSLAEAAAWGLPMIAVPYLYAAEDHQRHNARYYAASGAAILLDERELTAVRLRQEVSKIFEDSALRQGMSQAALGLARPQAADELAQVVLELARSKRKLIN